MHLQKVESRYQVTTLTKDEIIALDRLAQETHLTFDDNDWEGLDGVLSHMRHDEAEHLCS